MEEIFKDIYYIDKKTGEIIDYRGKYQVSNLGNIKSLNYNHEGFEKIIAYKVEKNGYARVGLFDGFRQRLFSIHRLVATLFLPNPNNFPQVNHIDENKLNNSVDNLEWCSCKYNINYGHTLDNISRAVIQYSPGGLILKKYKSIRQAARELGVCNSWLGKCIREQREIKGSFFKYAA